MKPTLEQIRLILEHVKIILAGKHTRDNAYLNLETVIYALELAEQIELGEVVLEQPWQPIETKPNKGDFLIFTECNEIFHTYDSCVKAPDPSGGGEYYIHDKKTHWKPLPQPPQEDSE